MPAGSRLVIWARGLDGERMWALEDCRHVSGTLERLVIARGGGVLNLAYGALLGYAIVMTRVRGAPAAPKEARKRVTALASELHRVGGRGAAAVLPHEAT